MAGTVRYDPDALDVEEDQQDGDSREIFRENIVVLIDATAPMLEPACTSDKEFEGKIWVEVALATAREMMKTRIVQSENDNFAIVLYGTMQQRNENEFPQVYVLQGLDVPDASRINQLYTFDRAALQAQVGSAASRSPDQLKFALWSASVLLAAAGAAQARKRVLVFTNDPAPDGGDAGAAREGLVTRSGELHDAGALVELFPLVPPGAPFDVAGSVWRELLALVGGGELAEYDGMLLATRFKSLSEVLRIKGHKKRVLQRCRWALSDHSEIACALYALVQPARVPAPQRVRAEDNKPLRAETAYLSEDTARALPAEEMSKKQFPKPSSRAGGVCRFPPVVFEGGLLREIKAVQPPGLRLLGFKPRSYLADWQNMRNSTFVYPDERSRAGSTTAFVALYEALLSADKVAICSLVRSKNSEPKLVAALPQREVVFEEGGAQVVPPGLALVYLPWADDVRSPESDTAWMGIAMQRPREDEIEAACRMIDALKLDGFYSGDVPNPTLQRHWQVVEKIALEQQPPPMGDEDDHTLPQLLSGGKLEGAAAVGAIKAFKDAVYGPGYTADLAIGKPGAKKAAAGEKRKAPEEMMDATQLEALREQAADGSLLKLKAAQLQELCVQLGLPKSGNKGALVERVTAALRAPGGGPPAPAT